MCIRDRDKTKVKQSIQGSAKTQQEAETQNELIVNTFFSGVQIVVVNDAGGAYAPVLEVSISELDLFLTQLDSIKLCAGLTLEGSYYNLIASRWEPFLEENSLTITVQSSEVSSPRTLIQIEMNQNTPVLNLNISEELILTIVNTMKTCLLYTSPSPRDS
eukprot:TRINITY_DN692_c0_g1_i1.p1 TRINITY_DN692_c0_g1~~TRINITY_DN692_c0_g1_i1.p1  ORF type:complete len:160 (-),score=35.50 TRINITY_DN692_c0_g1_i1:39-518(-)